MRHETSKVTKCVPIDRGEDVGYSSFQRVDIEKKPAEDREVRPKETQIVGLGAK